MAAPAIDTTADARVGSLIKEAYDPKPTVCGWSIEALKVAYELVCERKSALRNCKKARVEFHGRLNEVDRLFALGIYFRRLLDGDGRMDASLAASRDGLQRGIYPLGSN